MKGDMGCCFWSWQIYARRRWATVYLWPMVVFREFAVEALFGFGVRWKLCEQSCTRTASPLPRNWSMSVRFERLAYLMKAELRYKKGECENKRAAEGQAYHRIKYWKRSKSRGRGGSRKWKEQKLMPVFSKKSNMKNKGGKQWKWGRSRKNESKAKDKQTGRERETKVLFLHLSKAAGV